MKPKTQIYNKWAAKQSIFLPNSKEVWASSISVIGCLLFPIVCFFRFGNVRLSLQNVFAGTEPGTSQWRSDLADHRATTSAAKI